jgi:hypothetical protein
MGPFRERCRVGCARGITLDSNVSGISAVSITDDLRRRCREIARLLNECEGEAALGELQADLSLVATRLGVAVAELAAPPSFAIEVELARSELAALKSEMALARHEEEGGAVHAHLRTALAHAFETMTWVDRVRGRTDV